MSDKTYVINLYTEKLLPWMRKYPFTEQQNKYGIYYQVIIPEKESRKITYRASKSKIKFQTHEKRWERGSGYRAKFIRNNAPPYRCRYCNKKLKDDQMVVDHLIPISKTKKPGLPRNLLYMSGSKDVNDLPNLVPSCNRCNQKKGSKMGLWYIRGKFGKYELYWVFLFVIKFFLILIIMHVIYMIATGNMSELMGWIPWNIKN